jgi:CubicO group peptidase (beta-lactamase class C family)
LRIPGNIDLDARLIQWADRSEPGCAVGIVEDGELVFSAGFGVEDLTGRHPITAESRFDIASEAKQFTAACIVLLEREGRIAMDHEIRGVLPELPDSFRGVTIAQLLHHTAGVPDFWALLVQRALLDRPCVLETVYQLICEMQSTDFPPGARFVYSNSGYALLALMAERIEGKPFGAILADRIFGPLGMADSFVHDKPGASHHRHAKGHQYEASSGYRESWHQWYAAPGAGCLYSTVRDLARWMNGLHGGKLAGPKLLARMMEPGILNDGSQTKYGMGLDWGQCFDALPDLSIITHGGGHGGSRAILLHATEHRFSIVLLCNNHRIDHARVALEMARRLAEGRR